MFYDFIILSMQGWWITQLNNPLNLGNFLAISTSRLGAVEL